MSSRPRRWLAHQGNRAFTWLWWSQTVSIFGNHVTLVAIPLLAAVSLRATPMENAVLVAVETIPYLAFSLPAGVLADRLDRRTLLIASNLCRASLLLAIPASAMLGWLSLPLLYVVALGIGTASVVFDVAYQSYVPELLEPDQLLSGNQRIELSDSAARTVGPTIGGALVAAVGSAMAIVVDTLSILLATVGLIFARVQRRRASDRAAEATSDPATPTAPRSLDTVWDYVAVLEERIADLERRLATLDRRPAPKKIGLLAGLRIVLRDPVLRDMAGSTAVFNLASSAITAVLVLFAVREVGMNGIAYGLLIGGGNVGFVLGALAVGAITRRFGVGPILVVAAILGAIATVLFPLATGVAAVGMLLAGRFIGALAIPLFNVNARALRQSRAPREALGRVSATFRLIDWGTLPIGALLGGWVAEAYGLRATLVLAGVLGTVSALWLVLSPLRQVRTLHETDEPEVPAALAAEVDRQLPSGRATQPARTPWTLAAFARLPTIRWPGLAIGGVLLQATLMFPQVASPLAGAAPVVYVVSGLLVLLCVLRNVRIPGLVLVALGGISNLVAVMANGGYMPVNPELARAAGHPPVAGYTNTVERVGAVLQPLTDIFVVPAPLPLANVYSVGDVLIGAGLLLTLVWTLLRSKPPPQPPGGPSARERLESLFRRADAPADPGVAAG